MIPSRKSLVDLPKTYQQLGSIRNQRQGSIRNQRQGSMLPCYYRTSMYFSFLTKNSALYLKQIYLIYNSPITEIKTRYIHISYSGIELKGTRI